MKFVFVFYVLLLCDRSESDLFDETVREKRQLSSSTFDEILLDGAFDAFLSQSNTSNFIAFVEIETLQTIQRQVIVEILDQHILSIHINGSVKTESNIYLHICYFSPIRQITVEGRVNILTDDQGIFNAADDALVLEHRGSANIALKLNVNDFEYRLIGTGNSRFHGQIRREAKFLTKGIGDIHAYDLATKRTSIFATGMNIIRVTALEDIQIEVNGATYVYYRLPFGIQPSKTIATGLGTIRRVH